MRLARRASWVQAAASPGSSRATGRAGRSALRCAGTAVDAVARDPLGRDERAIRGIRGEQLVRQRRVAELRVCEHPEDLGIHVAAQAPGLRLAEREGVDRGPGLGTEAVEPAARARERARDDESRRRRSPGGRRSSRSRPRSRRRRIASISGEAASRSRWAAPRQSMVRMKESVAHLARTEHLRQAAGADAAIDLHLPHPLRRVEPALGEEQVVGRGGLDARDAVDIAWMVTSAASPGVMEAAVLGRLSAGGHGSQTGHPRRPRRPAATTTSTTARHAATRPTRTSSSPGPAWLHGRSAPGRDRLPGVGPGAVPARRRERCSARVPARPVSAVGRAQAH